MLRLPSGNVVRRAALRALFEAFAYCRSDFVEGDFERMGVIEQFVQV